VIVIGAPTREDTAGFYAPVRSTEGRTKFLSTLWHGQNCPVDIRAMLDILRGRCLIDAPAATDAFREALAGTADSVSQGR
jgi:hypothetical protein